MARFVGHEPCRSCGSKDNLGRYDDGSAFCFGCKYSERATHAPRRDLTERQRNEEDDSSTPKLPDDTGTNYSEAAVAWLARYHVTVERAIQAGIRWSPSREQLIFLLEGDCWQARNFGGGSKNRSKYFTAGNVNDSIKLYLHNSIGSDVLPLPTSSLCIVEDCVSALRIASVCDAMPVLGSHVATTKLNRIARLYSSLQIWLDGDKLEEAKELATKAKMLGLSTNVIYTEDDPKCFTDSQLKEFLT